MTLVLDLMVLFLAVLSHLHKTVKAAQIWFNCCYSLAFEIVEEFSLDRAQIFQSTAEKATTEYYYLASSPSSPTVLLNSYLSRQLISYSIHKVGRQHA